MDVPGLEILAPRLRAHARGRRTEDVFTNRSRSRDIPAGTGTCAAPKWPPLHAGMADALAAISATGLSHVRTGNAKVVHRPVTRGGGGEIGEASGDGLDPGGAGGAVRVIAFGYGLFAYIAFVAVLGYGVAFMGDLGVPRSVSFGPAAPLGRAIVMDLALLALFAFQHSIMARPGFKRMWTRIIPPSVERNTYVLAASAALALVFWQWRPLPGSLWSVASERGRALLWALFVLGWIIALLANTPTRHLDLFGVRHAWLRLQGRRYESLPLRASGLYACVRHPMALGLLIALWSAPDMTLSRFLFAAAGTGYTVLGTLLEERDLVRSFPTSYPAYRRDVPMFLPIPSSPHRGGDS